MTRTAALGLLAAIVASGAGAQTPIHPTTAENQAAFERSAGDWISPTGGCRDARTDMLVRAAKGGVAWGAGKCTLEKGLWQDAITGATLTEPNAIVLTHTVPLDWAQQHGAQTWGPAQRAAFFSDRENLLTLAPETAHALPAPLSAAGPASHLACARSRAFASVVQRHGLALDANDAAALRATLEETCAPPSMAALAQERAARADSIQAARAAFDVLHGVTPAERAAGPDPAPSSYPEGRHVRTIARPVAPNPITGEIPAPATLTTADPHLGMARPQPRPSRSAQDRPPVALPGAYRTAAPVQENEQGRQRTRATTPNADQPEVGLGVGGFGIDPNDPGGTITTAEEFVDVMAEEMEARGIMPGNYAPGTAPDANEIMREQGIDPSQFPGFDGDPAMMGMFGPGTSITIAPPNTSQ